MSFDRDLRNREKAKYDDRYVGMEEEAKLWIEGVVGERLQGGGDLIDQLRDGVVLCRSVASISHMLLEVTF